MEAQDGAGLRHRPSTQEEEVTRKSAPKMQVPSEQNLRNRMADDDVCEKSDNNEDRTKFEEDSWQRQLLVRVLIAADVWLVPVILIFICVYILFLKAK